MNIFNTILQKLGIEKPAAPAASTPSGPSVNLGASATSGSAPAAAAPAPVAASYTPAAAAETVSPASFMPAAAAPSAPAEVNTTPVAAAPEAPAAPVAVPMVDVVSKLEGLARSRPDLNWKVSIVDMLKLLGITDSLEDLALELSCPAFEMADSARRNVWLHKTVLQKIAENGGNIPANLLK